MVIYGQSLLPGRCTGAVVWTNTPLSFWGGVDPQTGQIVDRHHPLFGRSIATAILVMSATRGSSTSSGILLEMLRAHTAPVGIITHAIEPVLALASIIGVKMYQSRVVMVTVRPDDFNVLERVSRLTIHEDGTINADERGIDPEISTR